MIESWTEKFKNTDCVLTPPSLDLFDKGGGGLLNNKERELFHSVIAKGIYIGCRSRPDILPTISALSSRVREPNKSDWEKD